MLSNVIVHLNVVEHINNIKKQNKKLLEKVCLNAPICIFEKSHIFKCNYYTLKCSWTYKSNIKKQNTCKNEHKKLFACKCKSLNALIV